MFVGILLLARTSMKCENRGLRFRSEDADVPAAEKVELAGCTGGAECKEELLLLAALPVMLGSTELVWISLLESPVSEPTSDVVPDSSQFAPVSGIDGNGRLTEEPDDVSGLSNSRSKLCSNAQKTDVGIFNVGVKTIPTLRKFIRLTSWLLTTWYSISITECNKARLGTGRRLISWR